MEKEKGGISVEIEHIFPIIGKFHRLSVRMYEMFAAEKPRHIRP